jgi:hypothetical protein
MLNVQGLFLLVGCLTAHQHRKAYASNTTVPDRNGFACWQLSKLNGNDCLLFRNDEKTAADYKVTGGSVLHLVLALRGGSVI